MRWRTERNSPGFSLIELMIAIMILGVGMVMVATVFPIGLSVTRDTMQMSISLAATESALHTVQLKVPTRAQPPLVGIPTPPHPPDGYHKVLVPDVAKTEILQRPAVVDQQEMEVYGAFASPTGAGRTPVVFQDWVTWSTLDPTSQTPEEFVGRTRVFTEWGFWDAQGKWPANTTFVLPSQNLRADTRAIQPEVPPFIVIPAAPPDTEPDLPRIHLADRVYPPVEIGFDPGPSGGWIDPETRNVILQAGLDAFVAERAAERRYAWTAIHRRVPSHVMEQSFLVTIVVTHRANLNEQYARQSDTIGNGLVVDPSDSSHIQALLLPQPADPVAEPSKPDTLFPAPWLVALHYIDPAAGIARCSAEVAQLLPTGSFFIVARAPASDQNFPVGTAIEVLDRVDPGVLGSSPPDQPTATLQVTRGEGSTVSRVLVWVFPPAIVSRVGPQFGSRCPVVGVFLREVNVP